MIMLLPTTDREALLSFLNPQPLEDGCVKVTLRGQETFAATKGKYTVLGPDLQTVKAVAATGGGITARWSAPQVEGLVRNHLSVWVDVKSFLSSWSGIAPGSLSNLLGGGLSGAALPQSGIKSVQLSTRIEPDGVALEALVDHSAPVPAAPRSETTDSLLGGLLNEPFVLAIGMTGDPAERFSTWLLGKIMAYLTMTGVCDADRADRLVKVATPTYGMIQSAAVSISLLPDGGRLAQTKVLRVRGDARALVSRIQRVFEVLKGGLFVEPAYNRVLESLEFRKAAETSGGVSIDHLVADLSKYEAVGRDALRRIIGAEQLVFRIGVVDERHLVIAYGGGIERFDRIVKTLRAGQAPVTADVGLMMSAMGTARKRSVEAYFALDRYLRLMRRIHDALERPGDYPDMPDVNAPVALTVHEAAPGMSQIDVFVPIELLVAVKDAVAKPAAPEPQAQP